MTSRSKAKNVTRKEKEKETETPAPPNSPSYMATKIPRTQKIIVSRSPIPLDISENVDRSLIVFGAPSGSEKHATLPFYIQKNSNDSTVHQHVCMTMTKERPISFGVTQFEGKGQYLVVVPFDSESCEEDRLILDRIVELENEAKSFLLSKDGEDFWSQVGIPQPRTREELMQHWSSPINHWVTKITKQPRTDIRMKFFVNFSKHPEYIATDFRTDEAGSPADLTDLPAKTMIKGQFGFREIYLRPVTSKHAKYPYNVGISVYVRDVGFYQNPDEQVQLLED